HTVARLIGAPPGYVGYEEGGQLTEAVRRRPYSVILFDEIEKAHHDVFNVLLQLLDDASLTDGHGRPVAFPNTLLIRASNLGSHLIQEMALTDPEGMRRRVMEAVQQHFRPEFLNRVDEIIIFQSLSVEQIKQIVEIQLGLLRKRLAERHITLTLTEAAKEAIALAGFDPVYGARPLKRAIQRQIQDPLAQRLLAGEFQEGDHVVVDSDAEGALTFTKQEAPEPVAA